MLHVYRLVFLASPVTVLNLSASQSFSGTEANLDWCLLPLPLLLPLKLAEMKLAVSADRKSGLFLLHISSGELGVISFEPFESKFVPLG